MFLPLRTISATDNHSSFPQTKEFTLHEGVSNTETTSNTITTSLSAEISGAFRLFSASGSASISHEWKVNIIHILTDINFVGFNGSVEVSTAFYWRFYCFWHFSTQFSEQLSVLKT